MFTELSQKNVDHYNAHPVAHTVMVASYGVCTVLVLHKLFKKFVVTDNDRS